MSEKSSKPKRPASGKPAKKRAPKRGYESPPGRPEVNQQAEWPEQGERPDQRGGRGGRSSRN